MEFGFERMAAYREALAFSKEMVDVTSRIKIDPSYADQLRRSSSSIAANLAEGWGRWHAADKAHFYRMALGSAFECIPFLELIATQGIIVQHELSAFRLHVDKIASLITGLIKRFASARTDTGRLL